MGCGASNAVQGTHVKQEIQISNLTRSIHNGSIATHKKLTGLNLRNKFAKPGTNLDRQLSLIDESSLEKQTVSECTSKAIQTDFESINGYKTQYTQTDRDLFPDEELELLQQSAVFVQNYTTQETDQEFAEMCPSPRMAPLTPTPTLTSVETVSHANVNSPVTTKDVGTQVKNCKVNNSTQTRLAILRRNNRNNVHDSRPEISDEIIPGFTPKFTDFESQTDPLSHVLAANGAGNDLNVLHSYDVSSPFSHIEKELSAHSSHDKRKKKHLDFHLQEALNKLLNEMEDTVAIPIAARRKDAMVQTDNDPLTDEAPEFAARPPPSRKKEMIPSLALFREVDKIALEAPEDVNTSVQALVDYLCASVSNDLYKVRAIFRWITENIKYDNKYMGVSMTSNEILTVKEGVCKDYCQLFGDMCRAAGIRVKRIQGFAKGHDYRPGHQFKVGEDMTHTWNAVYIFGAWRFVDPTWGTGYNTALSFQKKLNEHFFFTDPESMCWTHFPYDDLEANYERWQLLDKAITLQDFNAMPKVTPFFFEFNLKIRTKYQNPITFRVQTEIKIGAHEPMRYKYKLYPNDEVENASLNHYVFCQLKEDRLVGSFISVPPIEGRYYLKIYAKPERFMADKETDSSSLHSALTFLLECTRARKYVEPFPLNELPWGPTQAFYGYKMKLHNQIGPVISTWGGKRRLCIESSEPMLITYQVMDSDGMEMDAKNLILRDDVDNKINFTISFPRVGMFKFMIFGMPKPKQKGKWRLPLLATFLIDCKLAKVVTPDEDPPPERVSIAELSDNASRIKRL